MRNEEDDQGSGGSTEVPSRRNGRRETMRCDYQGYEFGAGSYPDSVCIDGRLFDADKCDDDGNLYEPVEHIPCPICHRAEAIEYWTERNRLSGTPIREASKAARSLVSDIRQNRGLPK